MLEFFVFLLCISYTIWFIQDYHRKRKEYWKAWLNLSEALHAVENELIATFEPVCLPVIKKLDAMIRRCSR